MIQNPFSYINEPPKSAQEHIILMSSFVQQTSSFSKTFSIKLSEVGFLNQEWSSRINKLMIEIDKRVNSLVEKFEMVAKSGKGIGSFNGSSNGFNHINASYFMKKVAINGLKGEELVTKFNMTFEGVNNVAKRIDPERLKNLLDKKKLREKENFQKDWAAIIDWLMSVIGSILKTLPFGDSILEGLGALKAILFRILLNK